MDWLESLSDQPGLLGSGAAALVAGVYYLRKMARTDRKEEAEADHIISLNEAAKAVIESMKKRIEELTAEVNELKVKLEAYMRDHMDCERQNRELSARLLELSNKVATLEAIDRNNNGEM